MQGVNPVIIPDACYAIISSYEDELIATLKKRHAFVEPSLGQAKVKQHVRKQFCHTVTRACHGIDTSQLNMNLA